jgi:hypothetical protein
MFYDTSRALYDAFNRASIGALQGGEGEGGGVAKKDENFKIVKIEKYTPPNTRANKDRVKKT